MIAENKIIDKTFIITILLLYFGTCGGLWHITYWSIYDINYLQYITLSDIIKNFATPFITSAGFSVLIYFAIQVLQFLHRYDNPEAIFFGRGSQTKVGKFLNKWSALFITIYGLWIIAIIIFGDYTKYFYLPLMIAGPLGIYLTNRGLFSKQIINPDLRNGVITFLLLLPTFSFCNAKIASLSIYENRVYKVVDEIQLNQEYTTDRTNHLIGLKYIGATSDIVFLSKVDNTKTTMLNTKYVLYITYKPNKKKSK